MTDNEYPRALNGTGCLFGQHLAGRLDECIEACKADLAQSQATHKERLEKVERKLDRLTWAAVSVAIALATASVTMWIQYLTP